MQHSSRQTSWTTSGLALVRRGGLSAAFAVLTLVIPATARAQYSAPADTSNTTAIGEKYHIEFSGTLWNPTLFGVISSEQFGSNNASDIDFVSDLGVNTAAFTGLERLFHAAIFAGVKREHGHPAAVLQAERKIAQERIQRAEFIVHCDSQRLENAAHGVFVSSGAANDSR